VKVITLSENLQLVDSIYTLIYVFPVTLQIMVLLVVNEKWVNVGQISK